MRHNIKDPSCSLNVNNIGRMIMEQVNDIVPLFLQMMVYDSMQ